MRAILSKKGIELINELDGGIEVSGKKINLKGKNVTVVAEKSLSMNSDGPANFKEKGKFTVTIILSKSYEQIRIARRDPFNHNLEGHKGFGR